MGRRLRGRADELGSALVHRGWAWISLHGQISPSHPGGRRFAHLGEAALIAFPQGALHGERCISIGAGTLVAERVTLSAGMPGTDPEGRLILKVGQRCSIGRGSHIVAHELVEIGDHVFLAPNVYVTDQNHTYTDLDIPIGRQPPRNDPVVIGDGCWIGTGAVVLPGARLGRNVAVGAGAVVRGRFPDHCVIGGVPARVLRRYDPVAGWGR